MKKLNFTLPKIIAMILTVSFLMNSCETDDAVLSDDKKAILEFSIAGKMAEIKESDKTINLVTAEDDLTALTPLIKISDGATVSPSSESKQDFTNPVKYTVTAEDKSTAEYTVTVTKAKSSDKAILEFSIDGKMAKINEAEKTITLVTDKDNLKMLTPLIEVSAGASVSPSSEVEQDFTDSVTYTVTAEDGSEVTYEVTITSALCHTDTDFVPNANLSAMKDILNTGTGDSWKIKDFKVDGESVTEKYKNDRMIVDIDSDLPVYLRLFNSTGIKYVLPAAETTTSEDDGMFLVEGKDGSLNLNLSFTKAFSITSGNPVYYDDFTSRSYRIVSGADKNSVELRSCDATLILEKQEGYDDCDPSGEFMSFDDRDMVKEYMDGGNENSWKISEFTIGTADVTSNYDDVRFAYFTDGSSGFVYPRDSETQIAVGGREFLQGSDGELRLLFGFGLSSSTSTPYKDFAKRYYRVLKGANKDKIVFKSCTWDSGESITIVLEKL